MASPDRMPVAATALAATAFAFITLPLIALLIKADWRAFPADISSPAAMTALQLSFATAAAATVICLLLGVPLALYLSRATSLFSTLVRIAVNLPLILPPLVGGLALLMLLGRRGVLGAPLYSLLGVSLPFTTAAVVVAQVFVALPFMVISVEGALRSIEPGYARVAASLGAGPRTVLLRVVLPLAAPGLAAGTLLTFSRSLGEFGATALFAGNREGVTQTMPLAIYSAYNGGAVNVSAAIALALLLLGAGVAVLLLTRAWYPGGRGHA